MRGIVSVRAALVATTALGVVMFSPGLASAAAATTSTAGATGTAATVKPSTDCKVPSMTVTPSTAKAGATVTVSGQNFSGCTAQGSTAKPTAVIPLKVGLLTAAKVSQVLASTKTSADGSFSVTVTVPPVPTGGVSKIAIAAVSEDPATGLDYYAAAAINYAAATTTSATTSTTATSTATSTPASTSSESSTTSEAPTAVPAGSGGAGGTNDGAGTALVVGGAGFLLVGAGGLALARRRTARQH